ncbi:MAG: GNAT family N-acetyltransferase [Prevotella sp.]|nr:GNAT family N-acetyltransferase [Prevotella sp.]
MTTKQITPETQDEQIRQLYETAFPKDEQIPWEDLMGLIVSMSLDFTAYYQEDDLIGFTIVYPRRSYNWFWYFAVRQELRGKGLGQQILSLLLEKYKDSANILDMESPDQISDNQVQRRRRHDFYLRNGFRDTGVGKSYGTVDMTIMMIGEGTFTMQDYDEVLAELKSYWDWDEQQ